METETRRRNVCYYFSSLDETLDILRKASHPITKKKIETEAGEVKPRKEISLEGRIRLNSHKMTKRGTQKRYVDLTGQKFGRFTVIEYVGQDSARNSRWRCRCECGNERIVTSTNLRNGHQQSCGCLKVEKFVERVEAYRQKRKNKNNE